MKKKQPAFLLVLLSIVFMATSCSSDDDFDSTPDLNIVGLWELKSSTYNVTSNDPSASTLIKKEMEKDCIFLRDSVQFFSNGYYLDTQFIVPHPYLPENRSKALSQFTFKTKKNTVEVTPAINCSVAGFKARYKTSDNTMLFIPDMEAMNYYKSGRYLNTIGLDSTKVSVSKIEVTGYYEKILHFTED